MDRRLITTHSNSRLLVAAIMALALANTLGATPAAAKSATCSVKNSDSGRTYTRLQVRMAGASSITANTVIDQGLPQNEYRCDTGVRGGGIFGAGTLVGVICGPGGNVYGNTPDDCYLEP